MVNFGAGNTHKATLDFRIYHTISLIWDGIYPPPITYQSPTTIWMGWYIPWDIPFLSDHYLVDLPGTTLGSKKWTVGQRVWQSLLTPSHLNATLFWYVCLPALRQLFFRRFLRPSTYPGICPFGTFSRPEVDLRSLDFLVVAFCHSISLSPFFSIRCLTCPSSHHESSRCRLSLPFLKERS